MGFIHYALQLFNSMWPDVMPLCLQAPESGFSQGAAVSASTAAGGPCCLELMLKADAPAAQAAVAAGVSGLCWPDAEGASRAVSFSRSLLGLASVGHPELEGVVAREVLSHAIRSLTQVSTLVVQTQVRARMKNHPWHDRCSTFIYFVNRGA